MSIYNPNLKESKQILKTHPHKFYYDRLGIDLVCEVCKNNMEGMNYEVLKVPVENANLSQQGWNNRADLARKFGTDTVFVDNCVYVPKYWYRIKRAIEPISDNMEQDDKPSTMYDYEFPNGAESVQCPNCRELHKVFSYGSYRSFPFWIRLREWLHWTSIELRPYVIWNKICKKFSIFGWENGMRRYIKKDGKWIDITL